mmetsp:Transcript_12731/g.33829  ORF Transcript_12731/g.33829 Transcript_12731/m.33829 type:complete len:252 (-) Transcript_12731:337-1092(-)
MACVGAALALSRVKLTSDAQLVGEGLEEQSAMARVAAAEQPEGHEVGACRLLGGRHVTAEVGALIQRVRHRAAHRARHIARQDLDLALVGAADGILAQLARRVVERGGERAVGSIVDEQHLVRRRDAGRHDRSARLERPAHAHVDEARLDVHGGLDAAMQPQVKRGVVVGQAVEARGGRASRRVVRRVDEGAQPAHGAQVHRGCGTRRIDCARTEGDDGGHLHLRRRRLDRGGKQRLQAARWLVGARHPPH